MKRRYLYSFFYIVGFYSILFAEVIEQISLDTFIQRFPETTIIRCFDDLHQEMTQYPLFAEYRDYQCPNKIDFKPIYIMQIPSSQLYIHTDVARVGYAFINNYFIKEMQIKSISHFDYSNTVEFEKSNKYIQKQGKIAVVSHIFPFCYGHWIFDVLGQLALLEMFDIKYDYLAVPYYKEYMKESLDAWGMAQSKIIPLHKAVSIEADSIIIPSPVTQTKQIVPAANYNVKSILQYVRNKILNNSVAENNIGSKKIFISRKDGEHRRIPNEDEIFEKFKVFGFEQYELSRFSFKEQVMLFNNATHIVSFVGSGATNILFCKPGTHYIEISQKMFDATFFFLADMCDVHYYNINNNQISDILHITCWGISEEELFPMNLIQQFIENNKDILS